MRGRIVMAAALSLMVSACERGPDHNIVPIPQSVTSESGTFTMTTTTAIALVDASDA